MTYSLLKLLILMMIVDPTGDQNLTDTNDVYVLIGEIIRYCIVLVTPIILVLSLRVALFRRIRLNRVRFYVLIFMLCLFGYSIVVGLIFNIPRNVFNEALGMIPILFIPAILILKSNQQVMLARFILYGLIIVCSAKFALSQVEALLVYGVPSWKVLLRQSPLLIFPYCYFLIKILRRDYRYRNIVLFVIALILLLSSQARALNLAVLFATFILFIKFQVSSARLMLFIVLFAVAGFVQSYFTDIDVSNVVGFWSGDNYDNTVQYRVVQSTMLVERIVQYPFGVGLGYFTPGYLTYEDLDKPYQLELDLPNFATKLGVVAFLLYIFTYVIFAKIIYNKNSKVNEHGEISISYVVLIFSLLVYSIFQTFHSSVLYWMIYSISFSFIAYRDQRVARNDLPI